MSNLVKAKSQFYASLNLFPCMPSICNHIEDIKILSMTLYINNNNIAKKSIINIQHHQHHISKKLVIFEQMWYVIETSLKSIFKIIYMEHTTDYFLYIRVIYGTENEIRMNLDYISYIYASFIRNIKYINIDFSSENMTDFINNSYGFNI